VSIPCLHARARQARSLLALDPLADTQAAPHSYGVRLARATAEAMEQGHSVLALRPAAPWLLAGDIRSCCESFAHDWLGAHSPMEQAILRQWGKAGFLDHHGLSPTAAGVPPGSVASPVIMHLALNGVERHSTQALPAFQGHTRTTVQVLRGAEDCIVTGHAKMCVAQEVHPLMAPCLAARGLVRSYEKTRGTHSANGVAFLGTHVRKYQGKLLGTPAKKNVRPFFDTIRGSVQRHQHAITGNVSRQLHPVLRGWAPYHQHGARQRTLARVDQQSFPLRWQGARRRHPRTSRHGMRDKYCRSEDGHHWGFFGHGTPPQGTQKDVRLFRASSVAMRRHTKMQGEAHPYDPQWEPYVDARLGVRRARNLRGRRHLMRLWQEQDGLWAVGQQRITPWTGWHSPHLVGRTQGGSDRTENRVRLHPNGQAQVHSHGWTVVQPRPPRGVRKA
jgi:RNA-directed DNA polymerase